jgi:hypothetical protein
MKFEANFSKTVAWEASLPSISIIEMLSSFVTIMSTEIMRILMKDSLDMDKLLT